MGEATFCWPSIGNRVWTGRGGFASREGSIS